MGGSCVNAASPDARGRQDPHCKTSTKARGKRAHSTEGLRQKGLVPGRASRAPLRRRTVGQSTVARDFGG